MDKKKDKKIKPNVVCSQSQSSTETKFKEIVDSLNIGVSFNTILSGKSENEKKELAIYCQKKFPYIVAKFRKHQNPL